MNWTNFDILVRDLNTLKGTTPEMFHYGNYHRVTEPGCVDCRCRLLMKNDDTCCYITGPEAQGIKQFLTCNDDDAVFLWMSRQRTDPHPQETGIAGIENALHRLKTLAEKHGHAWPLDQPFVGDEAAFLKSVRQLATEPVQP